MVQKFLRLSDQEETYTLDKDYAIYNCRYFYYYFFFFMREKVHKNVAYVIFFIRSS